MELTEEESKYLTKFKTIKKESKDIEFDRV